MAVVPSCTSAAPPCLTGYTLTDSTGKVLAVISIGSMSYTLTKVHAGQFTYHLVVEGKDVAGGVVVSTPSVATVTVP